MGPIFFIEKIIDLFQALVDFGDDAGRNAAWKLDRECKEMTYTYTLQGPNKYFEDLNDKFLQLEHLKVLKIDDDANKKTIATC